MSILRPNWIQEHQQTLGVGVTLFFIEFSGSMYEIRTRAGRTGIGRFCNRADSRIQARQDARTSLSKSGCLSRTLSNFTSARGGRVLPFS